MRYGYIFTRLAEMLPVLLIVVVATFFLAHAVPGGPFEKDRRMPPEVKKRLEEYYGLDKPLASQPAPHMASRLKARPRLLITTAWRRRIAAVVMAR